MGKSGIVALIVVILAVAGGAFALTRKTGDKKPATSTPTSTQSTDSNTSTTPNTSPTDQQAAGTIVYTNNGFSPTSLTVKSGSKVTIKNDSTHLLQFDSNPHPDHTDDPELNAGVIAPGQSKTITVTMTGTHGYHNHANDSETGTLVVQ